MEDLKVISLNIANQNFDDEHGFSLYDRIPKLCELIERTKPDVLFLMEAARTCVNSKRNRIYWDEIVSIISESTGMSQKSCYKNTKYATSIGISCFYNPERVKTIFTNRVDFGTTDFTSIGVNVNVKFNDQRYRFMCVHLPTDDGFRMKALENLLSFSDNNPMDFICGDFNNYEATNGSLMLEKINEKFDVLTNNVISYVSFPHRYVKYNPSFNYFSERRARGMLGAIGGAIDLILKPKESTTKVEGGVLNPFTYKLVNKRSERSLFYKIVRQNTVESRVSDHLPTLIRVSK